MVMVMVLSIFFLWVHDLVSYWLAFFSSCHLSTFVFFPSLHVSSRLRVASLILIVCWSMIDDRLIGANPRAVEAMKGVGEKEIVSQEIDKRGNGAIFHCFMNFRFISNQSSGKDFPFRCR
ncbi:hypothetical protein BO82DRAFT_27094 [Aspergillus uvarum CBS 121591]|uniref:Uncharacterized protein n=1 Tax=Aspergillus uvarum CBS 121591 TaxID=1448315 RepID=A0A319CJ73_9EURO|nr:hypothetical protein BO82DRAFT_27094 [Aspergillus uvarum CBS 121591]PYH75468.1 hypothetical protein BO82DRAFT_27094 [Aspergillus uvarum CBS 121591]